MNTQDKVVKERKYYLEALRVIAILLVMYNHSPAFMSFQDQTKAEYGVSLFLSMICKAAVPIFFMISGYLFFVKVRTVSDVFKNIKRKEKEILIYRRKDLYVIPIVDFLYVNSIK